MCVCAYERAHYPGQLISFFPGVQLSQLLFFIYIYCLHVYYQNVSHNEKCPCTFLLTLYSAAQKSPSDCVKDSSLLCPCKNVSFWWRGRWSWLSGIQQDKRTTTDCVHCLILTPMSSSCASPLTALTVSVNGDMTWLFERLLLKIY